MRDMVEFIAKALVDHPEAVHVRQVEGERAIVIEVKVAPDDIGKIIGKQGRIVNALRTVVKAAAVRTGKRVTVEILQ
ncbi:MAG: KH domain-containing protein [Bacillati bacterium ANGP1]|uniref:RNA-binding protein KhpA n=1 Tax=Candidatus Segetimicrobium genomatis TaxID=2569760 RepID=A0A537IXU4_9BACT|nr:MAG: KH domain-containing protein [Terrabacteria group bacterium ANGP1]